MRLDLVPIVFGSGKRMLDGLVNTPILLETPTVIEGTGVTHLVYRMKEDT